MYICCHKTTIMETILRYSKLKLSKTSLDFTRYLINEIAWDDQLIGIKGARGVGKTTLMLQRYKSAYGNSAEALYVSLDNFYFTKNRLFDFAERFYLNGGRVLFLDEVHRYPTWSIEIKNLYDIYDDLKIVFSGSSALELHKADGDLSRRAAMYDLHELSFREYLELAGVKKLDTISINDILTNHMDLATEIRKDISIMPHFKKYLKEGVYPFFKTTKGRYNERLSATINIIIESDLQIIEGISFQTAFKLRQLVAVLADSVPFKVNVSELSRKIGLSRDLLLRLLSALDRASLIKGIQLEGSSVGAFTKPDKIYMHNTSLLYALYSGKENFSGTVRETFFVNQLIKDHRLKSVKKGDFIVDRTYTFEIGGRNKSFNQIADVENSFIAADDLEVGYGNKIPLWLFGLMY